MFTMNGFTLGLLLLEFVYHTYYHLLSINRLHFFCQVNKFVLWKWDTTIVSVFQHLGIET